MRGGVSSVLAGRGGGCSGGCAWGRRGGGGVWGGGVGAGESAEKVVVGIFSPTPWPFFFLAGGLGTCESEPPGGTQLSLPLYKAAETAGHGPMAHLTLARELDSRFPPPPLGGTGAGIDMIAKSAKITQGDELEGRTGYQSLGSISAEAAPR